VAPITWAKLGSNRERLALHKGQFATEPAAGEERCVGAQELYGRFRKRIEDLANSAQPRDQCLAELRDVLQRFDADIADLDNASAQWLRGELCQQFEQEVLRATRRQRRDVLAAALKHLELGVI